VTEADVCEQPAKGCYLKVEWLAIKTKTSDHNIPPGHTH